MYKKIQLVYISHFRFIELMYTDLSPSTLFSFFCAIEIKSGGRISRLDRVYSRLYLYNYIEVGPPVIAGYINLALKIYNAVYGERGIPKYQRGCSGCLFLMPKDHTERYLCCSVIFFLTDILERDSFSFRYFRLCYNAIRRFL